MLFVAEGRRHHAAGGVVPILVEIFAFIQCQMLDQRLAPDALALLAGAADGLVAVLAGGVHDIERHTGHIGDHDGAVGGLALDLRRAGIGMRLRPGVALGEKFCRKLRHHIAVFGMDHGDAAQFGKTLERCVKFVVVHHKRALVGHEMLEGVDAAIPHHPFHFVKDLLAPPCHGHVERVVAIGAGRFVVPHLKRVKQPLPRRRQRKIDNHRRATRQRGAGAAFEIVAGIGAHERHFEMRVRVDPAGHHIAAGCVQFGIALEVFANGRDLAILDRHIGLVGPVVGDDGAVADDRCHGSILPVLRCAGVRLCFLQTDAKQPMAGPCIPMSSGPKSLSTTSEKYPASGR